jgi:hypothetical protein
LPECLDFPQKGVAWEIGVPKGTLWFREVEGDAQEAMG